MGRDLVTNPYGRFFHLPRLLAERGHDVRILLLDYEGGASVDRMSEGMRWISASVTAYAGTIRRQLRHDRPDWIIGFSDTYFGILATRYGRKFGIRSCIDAYDNYESYLPWLKPLHWAWRSSLAQADLITAAGPALIDLMAGNRSRRPTAVVPMASDPIGFEPRDRSACREQLGLPLDARLVGYIGSMHRSRGVGVLFDAIPLVRSALPDVRFIHSGRTWKDVPLPPAVTSLGYIDDDKVPILVNSMDVLVVINRPSSFGHYSHPVKLYEAMSCGVPVIATRTTATEWILAGQPDRLVEAENPGALSRAIVHALDSSGPDYGIVPTWQSSCDILERALARDEV